MIIVIDFVLAFSFQIIVLRCFNSVIYFHMVFLHVCSTLMIIKTKMVYCMDFLCNSS